MITAVVHAYTILSLKASQRKLWQEQKDNPPYSHTPSVSIPTFRFLQLLLMTSVKNGRNNLLDNPLCSHPPSVKQLHKGTVMWLMLIKVRFSWVSLCKLKHVILSRLYWLCFQSFHLFGKSQSWTDIPHSFKSMQWRHRGTLLHWHVYSRDQSWISVGVHTYGAYQWFTCLRHCPDLHE